MIQGDNVALGNGRKRGTCVRDNDGTRAEKVDVGAENVCRIKVVSVEN